MKNEKLFRQFTTFLRAIQDKPLNSETIKLINLMIANFDEIAQSGTAAGKRAKTINDLIQKKETQTAGDAIKFPEERRSTGVQKLLRLHSLEAAHFRGFTDNCMFSFDKQFVLVYGPNGSGKSSLCESLEYSLLGYINEAEQKRISVTEYIKNSYATSAKIPLLNGIDENGELVSVVPDADLYHFCFIEKCRIDAFARLSGHTPTNQKELLSALFGLEQFDSFVSQFTDNIENYISIDPVKENEFNRQKQSIASYREMIEDAEIKRKLRQEEKEKIQVDSKTKHSFEQLDVLVHGSGEEKGWLTRLQEQLTSSNITLINYPSVDNFFICVNNWTQQITDFRQTHTRYESLTKEIDFSNLYASVLIVEKYATEYCPACETPLAATVKNPYHHAQTTLATLKDAAEIEQLRKQRWSEFIKQKDEIIELLEAMKVASTEMGTTVEITIPPDLQKKSPSQISLQNVILPLCDTLITDTITLKTTLKKIEESIAQKNQEAKNGQKEKEKIVMQYNAVKILGDRIKKVQMEEKTSNEFVEKAKVAIEAFDANTGKLQKEVLEEAATIAKNKKYIEAYKLFKKLLQDFKDHLPIDLVKDLNHLVIEFYNLINKEDDEKDLLAAVQLPAIPQQTINLSFRDHPHKQLNALHVLSEGHIKCLGLSILLAKAVHSGANFLVFDDIVNAIDDDHRGYIRDLFLNSPHFADKQLIVTSHSEEFIKDFENRIPKDQSLSKIQTITLLRRSGKKIEKIETTLNYLQRADKGLSEHNKREVLSNCRRALENISAVLWNRLINLDGGKYSVKVSVQLWSPRHKPELLALLKSLRKVMNGINYVVITEIGQLIDWFSGLETTQPNIWNFLNKGTHEEADRDDFDSGIVKEIFSQTCLLDEKVKGTWDKKL